MPFSAKFAISFITISAVIITALMCLGISFKEQTQEVNGTFMLKTYNNTVALYQNGNIVEVYEQIVLNTLPKTDILMFNKGIPIENISKIDEFLQDYDG